MSFRTLTTVQELESYRACAERQLGIRYPLEYLARARVLGFFEAGRLVGGFALITRGPFRCVSQLPEHVQRELGPLTGNTVEANALFLDRSARGAGTALRFWLRLAWELLRSGRSLLLFSHATHCARLNRLYAPLSGRVVYRGRVRALEGMTGPEVETVRLCTSWRAALLPLLRPDWTWRRVRGRLDRGASLGGIHDSA